MTFTDAIIKGLRGKFWEPEISTRDRSVREMKYGPHRIMHRFPIKGGLTFSQAMIADDVQRPSPWMKFLRKET